MEIKLKVIQLEVSKPRKEVASQEMSAPAEPPPPQSDAAGRSIQQQQQQDDRSPLFSNETFSCEKCDEEFPTDALAIQHANAEHASKGEMDYQCDICLVTFKVRQVFKRHRNAHGKGAYRSWIKLSLLA